MRGSPLLGYLILPSWRNC